MSSPLCPGEYDCVSRASRHLELLRKAHRTPIDPIETHILITDLSKTWKSGSIELHIGRSKRGWGGVKRNRGYISLPSRPLTQCSAERPFGRLRVGLVLHEFAHVVMKMHERANGERYTPHGPEFTHTLDALLNFYFHQVSPNHTPTLSVEAPYLTRTQRNGDGQLSLFPEEMEVV